MELATGGHQRRPLARNTALLSQEQQQLQQAQPSPPSPLPTFIFRGHEFPIHCMEFFADNRFLVSADEQGYICIWDLFKQRPIHRWRGHLASILSVQVLPFYLNASTNLAPGGLSKSRRQAPRKQLQQQEHYLILTHGRDHEIRVWDTSTFDDIIQSKEAKQSHYDRRMDRIQKTQQPLPKQQDQEPKESIPKNSNSTNTESSSIIQPIFSLPVNALNFCKMAVLPIYSNRNISSPLTTTSPSPSTTTSSSTTTSNLSAFHQILVAVPSPKTSDLIDIYDIVKPKRLFASVGSGLKASSDRPINEVSSVKNGGVMTIQLLNSKRTVVEPVPIGFSEDEKVEKGSRSSVVLQMVAGFESGNVVLFEEEEEEEEEAESKKSSETSSSSTTTSTTKTANTTRKMITLWSINMHRDPVLALDISPDLQFVITCSSDNILGRIHLTGGSESPKSDKTLLKSKGFSDLRFRNDAKIVVMAGWDGKIRVFSAKTLKFLAVLKYHRESIYGLAIGTIGTGGNTLAAKASASSPSSSSSSSSPPPPPPPSTTASSALDSSPLDQDQVGNEAKELVNESDNDTTDSDSDSDDSVDLSRQKEWANRHWIAAGGKENRISLWEIY